MAGPKGATVVRRALLVLLIAWFGWCALAATQLAIVYAQQEMVHSVIACTRRGLAPDGSVFVARACLLRYRAGAGTGSICARKLTGEVITCAEAREGDEVELTIPYPPPGSGVLEGEVVAVSRPVDGDVVLPENSAAGASISEPAGRFIVLDVGIPEFVRAVIDSLAD